MAKTPRKKSLAFPPAATESSKPAARPSLVDNRRPFRWELILLFLVITLGGTYLAIVMRPNNEPPIYTFKVLKSYPHDPAAFTQGLLMEETKPGILWESTGRTGQSSIRKVELETGNVLLKRDLGVQYFGEGLALLDNKFFQLTWQNNIAFVYDRELNKLSEIEVEGDGWGLTSDGSQLIFSNGTSELRFLDPATFAVQRSLIVRRGSNRAGLLNELEYFNGNIYANVYQTDLIYEIDPNSGEVTAIIDLAGLWPAKERPVDGVLNGIAINTSTKKLLVTGKFCPKIFEIELQKSGTR